MAWTCPSCHRSIKRDDDEQVPRFGVVYRCHVCRLDLVMDANSQKLIIATDADARDRKQDDSSKPED